MNEELNKGKKFQRKIEDFTCNQCGFSVKGNGYTNHCPKCLWSRHVDINPGDRSATCGGMMEPSGIELKEGECDITHICKKCGKVQKNKSAKDDDFDILIKIGTRG
jgi:hypothetical protein